MKTNVDVASSMVFEHIAYTLNNTSLFRSGGSCSSARLTNL
jgi:hypothetical protein